MEALNAKVDGAGGANGTLPADEWNQVAEELQNVITSTGESLSGLDLEQVALALASYVAAGNFMTDSGAANAYVIAPIGGFKAGPTLVDGLEAEFVAANPNTTAATLNYNALGVKDIRLNGGAALSGGEITDRTRVRYDLANDWWELIRSQTAGQFNDSPLLASTAFVQRALGSHRGYVHYSTTQALGLSDIGKTIRLTGSGYTVTLPQLSTLADGAKIILKHFGSGNITVQGFGGTENIDNSAMAAAGTVTNLTLRVGDVIELSCATGVPAWQMLGSAHADSIFPLYQAGSAGYIAFGRGILIQWGQNLASVGGTTFNFPLTFNSVDILLSNPVNQITGIRTLIVSNTQGNLQVASGSPSCDWVAIGTF